uniref:Uncharacterized protein n=1 Tax=Rhizophora mucronata TaxID=61149 RepID=A0A2P2PRV9_RHIMU
MCLSKNMHHFRKMIFHFWHTNTQGQGIKL